MDEPESRRKRRVFDWPDEAMQLVRNHLGSIKMGQGYGRNALATLATRLVELSGNPRDACFRFLRQHGVTQKRAWRPWTKPEQQRLFDLIESCPVEEISKIMQRSPHSLRAMLHRLGESAQRGRDWFTIYSLAQALHVRSDEVQKWIDHGWLKCRIVETTGVKKRIIDPDDFSAFVKQYGPAVVGRRLNADGLWFVKNFVFPPKHAHLLPLRKSKDMAAAIVENDEDDEADRPMGQSA
ncbi:MAG: hypothetical protein ACJ71U_06370 [Terriglobales bacterium]